jgi:hypothetical protein
MMLQATRRAIADKIAVSATPLAVALVLAATAAAAAVDYRVTTRDGQPSESVAASRTASPAGRYAEARTTSVGANRTVTVGGAQSASKGQGYIPMKQLPVKGGPRNQSKQKGEIEILSHGWGATSKGTKPQIRTFPKLPPTEGMQKSRGLGAGPKRP